MIQTGKELANAAQNAAKHYKTIYAYGCFGWPMNDYNKERIKKAYAYNRKSARVAKIDGATVDTFGFDCVCLVKALLWGWCGDASKNYGGASYKSNGIPDVAVDGMLNLCTEVSDDFSTITVGEYLWMKGHCGIYIGSGLAVESTPVWKDGVQITAVHNLGAKPGYNGRTWLKHGKLPGLSYEPDTSETAAVMPQEDFTLPFRYLGKGCIGEDVRAAQLLLMGRNYSCGKYGADGDFGNATEKAVIAFQRDCAITADGIIGDETMCKLLGVKKA